MRREFHVRFCEGLGVQFPRATLLTGRQDGVGGQHGLSQVAWVGGLSIGRRPVERLDRTWSHRRVVEEEVVVHRGHRCDIVAVHRSERRQSGTAWPRLSQSDLPDPRENPPP